MHKNYQLLQILFSICIASLIGLGSVRAQGDDCAAATTVTSNSVGPASLGTETGFSGFSTGCAAVVGGQRDSWRTFTVNTPQLVRIEFTHLDAGTDNIALAAWSGTCGTLTNLGCVNTVGPGLGNTEAITFNAVAGITYYIQVVNMTNNAAVVGSLSVSNQFQINATNIAVGSCGMPFNITGGQTPLLTSAPCFVPAGTTTERWVKFIATATTQVRARYTNTDEDANILAYNSDGNPILTACGNAAIGIGTEEVRFAVTAGQEYYLRLMNPNNPNAVAGTICLENIAPETRTNALSVPSLGCTDNFYVFGTGSPDATSCLGAGADRDGWARFTASVTGTYTVSYFNENQNAGIAIYDNAGIAIGGACADGVIGTGTEEVTFAATVGDTYFIRVSNMSNTNLMNGTLCVYPNSSIATTVNTPGCNSELVIDLSDGVLDCGIGFTIPVGTQDAVTYPTSCSPTGTAFREGWASFIAPFTGPITVQYNNLSPLDASIVITRDNGADCTNGTLNQCANAVAGFGTESATINAVGGVKYYIRIVNTTTNTQPMPGELCVTTGSPPNADLCSNAQPVNIGTCGYQFDIPAAAFNNQNVALPAGCPVTVFRDAWVSFPVVASQTFTVRYNSLESDAALALYQGNCSSLTPLACANSVNDIGQEELTFSPNFTGTIYLRVMKIDNADPMTGTLCISEMVARDACAEALSSPTYLQTGDCDVDFNVASTFASTPGDLDCTPESPDAWVAYTADFTGQLRVDYTAINGERPALAVFEQTPSFVCGDAPAVVECGSATVPPDFVTVNVPVTTGRTYLIKIVSVDGTTMTGKICLYNTSLAAADDFFNAPTYVEGTNCGEQFNISPTFGSSTGNAPGVTEAISCAPGQPSILDGWAKFIPAATGDVVIEYDNRVNDPEQANDVALLVYEGSTVTTAPATGFVEDIYTAITTSLALNTTYTGVGIDNTGLDADSPGTDHDNSSAFGTFSGDAIARFTLAAPTNITISFLSNSPTQVPMVVYDDDGSFGTPFQTTSLSNVAENTGVYSLPAGNYIIHILNPLVVPITGASLTVYSGITQVACINALSDQLGIERLTLSATAGTTYYVRVANIEDGTRITNGTLCIRDAVVPQGDLCDDPITTTPPGSFCDYDFNLDAGFVNDQPIPDPICMGSYNLYKDGWLSFTATLNRTTIQYQSPSTDNVSMIAVYRGGCATPFLIGCTDPGAALEPNRVRTLRVNTIPGLEYKVRIMSVGLSATPTAAEENMNGKVCIFNTVESDVCNDNDLVTLNVNDCNVRFDVPAAFTLSGANLRNFDSGTLPLLVTTGSLPQNIESSCETESPFTATDTNVQPIVGESRDAWVRMNGSGGAVTLTYQNNEAGTLANDGSNPSIVVYTALEDVGPVNCGVGGNGAGNLLNQYACANNFNVIGKQTESVTFIANAGQRYIIRIIDMNGGNTNGMTGTLCISDGAQNYDDCADAREIEIGECSVPLNVLQGRNTCYVPGTNAANYPDITTAPLCDITGLGADGCDGGTSDAWATFTVDKSLLPGNTLPQTNGTQTDVTIEYDNRNYTFDVAADVALLVYRVTDCADGATFTLIGCADELGSGIEGVEKVLIPNVSDLDTYHVRVINRTSGQSLFGKVCIYYGTDIADENCPTTQSYGELSGEFRSFTVGNTAPWRNTSNPQSSIIDPACVVPGGSNPRTRGTDPIRAHGWVNFTVPVSGLPVGDPSRTTAVTVQYDNSGFSSGGSLQNAALAVYTVNNADPATALLNCEEAAATGDNKLLLIDCVDTVFEGAESVTIGVEEGRTYYVRVMNIANLATPGVMPGRIRIFPYAPCQVGDELVVDGGFEGWPGIDPGVDGIANNTDLAGYNRQLDDVMVTTFLTTTSAYPNKLDGNAKFATDYGFVRDRNGGNNSGNLPNNRSITDSTATYARFIENRGELGPEGRYVVKQSPWTVKGDWFSFGNGYSGYGGRTGGGVPVASYCLTGGGGFEGEPCVEITRNFANGPATTVGEYNIGIDRPSPFPYTSDANFMIVNGSYDPGSGLPPGKVWCQTVRRDGGTVGYYVFTIWVQNMISAGRNLDVPQLRLTVCDMQDPITGDIPLSTNPANLLVQASDNPAGISSILPGISIFDPTVKPYTIHSPAPPTDRLKAPRVDFSYGAAAPCNTPSEARDARIKILGSSFLIDERPDAWQVIRCIYRAPAGIEAMNICIENLSLTKNGNDFAVDDISFRECLNPDTEAFDRLLRGDPCELADTPNALNIPLGVTMLDFSGRLLGDKVLLNWITLRENNAAYFEVQRSLDGANFSPIGEVLAKGSVTTLNDYNFTDIQLPKGIEHIYYRLKIYNEDGTSKMGPLVRVNISGLDTFDLQIIPNPITQGDNVTLRFNVAAGKSGLIVADMMGNVLQQSIIETINGINDVTLNTSKLPSGVYIVQVSQDGRKVAKRLVVY